jgi:two-component system chemotaxis sensor kinase CheA
MAKDPYKYFRVEARELVEGLTQGVLELEKGSAAPDGVARLLRLAHTLKGAARVVKQAPIAELAHLAEDLLASHRGADEPLPPERANELLRLLDQITSRLRALEADVAPEQPKRAADASTEEPLETLRVDIREMDALLQTLAEAAVHLGGVRASLGTAERLRDLARRLSDHLVARPSDAEAGASVGMVRARMLTEELRSEVDRLARSLATHAEQVEGGFAEVRDLAHRLRLVPAHTVFPALDRAARDAAQSIGNQVELEAHGGDVRLDAHVLASLRDAVMHTVRNAVTHGIEPEAERRKAGKPACGRIRLSVERRGSRVCVTCEDDGRGVDLEAVRSAAVRRGLVSPAAALALAPHEVLALLRTGGVTTAASVTELSGRGIGLDVVRATALRLKGEFRIESEVGRGTTIELQVPVSIASLQGLLVEVSGGAVVIPLDSVRQTLRVDDAAIARSASSQSIVHEGQVIPFLALDRALRRPSSPSRRRRTWSAVVVHGGARDVAVGVDRLLGTANVVVRALPALLEADPIIAGACLDADGNPQLVLDSKGLLAAAGQGLEVTSDEPAPVRAPVLVVDDSLTTRMLEQSILESAGYDVELAVSAEDALEKARARRYSLFVVDVEMPGMDGFGFVAEVRGDPALRDIPAVLVTSRNAPEDRRRGEQAGAQAYIVKGEFDQGFLLKTIRRLVG